MTRPQNFNVDLADADVTHNLSQFQTERKWVTRNDKETVVKTLCSRTSRTPLTEGKHIMPQLATRVTKLSVLATVTNTLKIVIKNHKFQAGQ